MQKIKFHSDYIDQIPNQLQTNNMVSLYEFLYDLQTKNRPQHFKKHATHNGVVVDKINRLGFLIVDSYTLAPLTTDEGAARIFFSTDGDYKQICLKYDTEQKTIDNPYEIETKILFQRMNQIGYQALEFTKEDDNLNVFFYKNHRITTELIELREYLKENDFQYMRVCGCNNPYPEFDAFDWSIFIDYETKNETNGRLYGYEIKDPLKTKLKAIPINILRSDILIMVNPEIAHDFDVFDLDIPYESKDASHLNNTFYKVL